METRNVFTTGTVYFIYIIQSQSCVLSTDLDMMNTHGFFKQDGLKPITWKNSHVKVTAQMEKPSGSTVTLTLALGGAKITNEKQSYAKSVEKTQQPSSRSVCPHLKRRINVIQKCKKLSVAPCLYHCLSVSRDRSYFRCFYFVLNRVSQMRSSSQFTLSESITSAAPASTNQA